MAEAHSRLPEKNLLTIHQELSLQAKSRSPGTRAVYRLVDSPVLSFPSGMAMVGLSGLVTEELWNGLVIGVRLGLVTVSSVGREIRETVGCARPGSSVASRALLVSLVVA